MSLMKDLANREHERWSDWMKYLFEKSTNNPDGSVTIPSDLVTRWKRQMNTTYSSLFNDEKQSDKKEVIKTLKVIWNWFYPTKLLIILLIIILISIGYQYYHHIQGTDCGCLIKYFEP